MKAPVRGISGGNMRPRWLIRTQSLAHIASVDFTSRQQQQRSRCGGFDQVFHRSDFHVPIPVDDSRCAKFV
jgi:hypothetical protein